MITIRSRSTLKDYDTFFGTSSFNFDSYKIFCSEDTAFCIAAEITENSYKAYFHKINSKRKSQMGQSIYAEIACKGQRGDEDSKKFYNFAASCLEKPLDIVPTLSKISEKFDSVFTADVVDGFDDTRHTAETERLVSEKLTEFFNLFEKQTVEAPANILKPRTVSVNVLTPSSKKTFLKQLANITDKTDKQPMILVCTKKSISKEKLNAFCKKSVEKKQSLFVLVDKAESSLKLPYNAEIEQSVLEKTSSKTLLLKTWLGHLLTEIIFICVICVGGNSFLKQNKNLKSENARLTAENKELAVKNETLTAENKGLAEKNKTLIAEKADLEKKCTELQEKISRAKADLTESTEQTK